MPLNAHQAARLALEFCSESIRRRLRDEWPPRPDLSEEENQALVLAINACADQLQQLSILADPQ